MSKPKVRITPNPSTSARYNVSPSSQNKQRAAVGGSKSSVNKPQAELLFNKNNFIWMGVGILFVALGIILMSGGKMPNPAIWDESIIYNPVRMIVAPILMISGLIIEVFAIFRK
jgi:hypothetical protein